MSETIPTLLEPADLEGLLGSDNLLVIDLSRASTYQQMHIPGAVHLDYGRIVAARKPVAGLLPELDDLSERFSEIGIGDEIHVVAYDDEGGGKAARLLWTLDTLGHRHYSLLNGGLHAWHHEQRPLTDEPVMPQPALFRAELDSTSMTRIDGDTLLGWLDNSELQIIDARSRDEYTGQKCFADRGGHIPGAVHIEWTEFMDQANQLRLKPEAELRKLLTDNGIDDDAPVVVYCQTHHRSAHTWLVLKWLGYPVSGYEGSWSDWGNRPDTPIEL